MNKYLPITSSQKVATKVVKFLKSLSVGAVLIFTAISSVTSVADEPSTVPLFLSNPVRPLVMLNLSKDHQLFFKAYDDYSDIMDADGNPTGDPKNPNGDGTPDTTYNPKYAYFGYFDSYKCYKYSTANSRYEPSNMATSDHYCNDLAGRVGAKEWSGNFLNWATMTRMDVVRKILYGGKRSTDDASVTVLERAFLPADAHAFAKFYTGKNKDIKSLTPFDDVADNLDITSQSESSHGITICNLSYPTPNATTANNATTDVYSQDATYLPLIRVARGNYMFWASNERWQCNWYEEHNQTLKSGNFNGGGNGAFYDQTVGAVTTRYYVKGVGANNDNPSLNVAKNQKLIETGVTTNDYIARVLACVAPFSEDEQPTDETSSGTRVYGDCSVYGTTAKPVGLLQEFGDKDLIRFGLMTGSYAKNKSGGVLRKVISSISDEIDPNTGITRGNGSTTAISKLSKNGIIATLDTLRLFGYDFKSDQGLYNNDVGTIKGCPYGLNYFDNGVCSNWGNPQGEIFLESLRYLTGLGSTKEAFKADDSKYIKDVNNPTETLLSATWDSPINNQNYCASVNVLQFNSSSTSYDVGVDNKGNVQGEYDKVTDIGMKGASDLDSYTDSIGSADGLAGKSWFFGRLTGGTGTDLNELCTAKKMSKLSSVVGTCTDAPRLNGGFAIAGLAYYARSVGLPVSYKAADGVTTVKMQKNVNTFGVALAPSVPKLKIALPSNKDQFVTIQPACRNSSKSANCAIVDFKVLSLTTNSLVPDKWPNDTYQANSYPDVTNSIGKSSKATYGTLYVNWEDSEQGGDYDQDMWGLIDFAVSDSKIWIRTKVIAQSTGDSMAFGYILSGSDNDTGFKAQAGINNFVDASTSCSVANSCSCLTSGTFGACNDNSQEAVRVQTFGVASTVAAASTVADSLNPPLYYAAQWGGYSDSFATANSSSLQTALAKRDPSKDTYGKNYFYSVDPRDLKNNLQTTLESITKRIASAAAVATDSTRLSAGTYLYQAQFNSSDWTGHIYAYAFNSSGNLIMDKIDPKKIEIQQLTDMSSTAADKNIYVGLGGNNWVKLDSATSNSTIKNLFTPSYKTKSASPSVDLMNWFLGAQSVEEPSGAFRSRSTTSDGARNTLGDVVNSSPVLAANDDDYHFSDLPSVGGSYADYLVKKKKGKNLLIVGANDGMLHVFDSDKSKKTLTELFTYMPKSIFPKVLDIANTNYGTSANGHKFTVDGPLSVSDVYIKGDWHTVVVGTLGAGGKAVFGIDITDPSNPSLLFEINTNTAGFSSLGYVMGRPLIVPLRNGRWAAVFGNGEQGLTTATSSLMLVDLESPYTNSIVLDTGGGSGLSAPAILINASREAIKAYAGDLSGNLWHFDLSDTDSSTWKRDYKLFEAYDASNNPQPIFAAPTVGRNFSRNQDPIVYFGTGKYYDPSDNKSGSVGYSFYAINDIAGESAVDITKWPLVSGKSTSTDLQSKSISTNYGVSPPVRTDTSPTIDWKTYKGWRLDFGKDGEKVTTKPILLADKLIFPTLIPSTVPCEYGGKSWLMSLAGVGDKFLTDKVLDNDIYNSFLVLGDLGVGINGESGRVIGSGSDSTIINQKITLPKSMFGRQSWRQLK